jgi:hypothetical protein
MQPLTPNIYPASPFMQGLIPYLIVSGAELLWAASEELYALACPSTGIAEMHLNL